jgi:broad specificity phosphatase PhoE
MPLPGIATVVAVRHADIDLPPTIGNPALNAEGRRRADALARVVGDAGVDAIFTSQFTRTRQTVAPVAARLGLTPQLMPPPAVFAQQIHAGELGDVVLVAGHSDTIPEILTALGALPPPPITEAQFDNLYLTAVSAQTAQLLHLRYGAA